MDDVEHRHAAALAAIGRNVVGFPLTGWQVLGEGFGGTVLIHPERGEICRVARNAGSGQNMRRTVPLLRWLAPRVPFQVPEPRWLLAPGITPAVPDGAFGYLFIAGEPFRDSPVAAETLTMTLLALHQLLPPPAAIGLLDPPAYHAERRAHYMAIRPALAASLDSAELAMVDRWQAQEVPTPLTQRTCPVHGDFWHENLLADKHGHVTAVLDWENAAVGDPAQDLAAVRYLGESLATDVIARWTNAMGEDTAGLDRRIDWWRTNRTFDGLYRAWEMTDCAEFDEEIGKLRAGPILNGASGDR